jgi:hypothetical protein
LNVVPVSLSLPYLEVWFDWGETYIELEDEGVDITSSSDKGSDRIPTGWRILEHAHKIVRHLGLPDPPPEPRARLDSVGCGAELRRVRDFLRRELSAREYSPMRISEQVNVLLSSFLSASELASMLGLEKNAVEVELRRHRKDCPDCAVDIGADRRRGEPSYLYRVSDVLPHLKEHFRLTDD